MRKMDYKAFIIALIGLALGKILNRSFGNNDMILVVMGAASLLLGGYYYWKKEHQDCIVLMLVFAISCFIPVTLGQYSEDIRYLSLIGSVAFMIMGINVFVVCNYLYWYLDEIKIGCCTLHYVQQPICITNLV